MRSLIATLIFASAIVPGIAFAGTCAAPTPGPPANPPNGTTVSGSTCGGQAGINMGGTIYSHPSQVYAFKANNSAGQFTMTGQDREMSITTSCTSAPIASGGQGVPIPATVLVNGTDYLLIVTSDPSIPLGSSPVCGEFAVLGPFPVSLQNFSVD